jgi:hypothetical protein
MTTISSIMNTTLSALQTQEAAIAVTSNNIANVNTDGYTRQTVVISSTSSGTTATSKRVYDSCGIKQLCSAKETLGEYTAKAKYLDSIEVIFDESEGTGLSEALCPRQVSTFTSPFAAANAATAISAPTPAWTPCGVTIWPQWLWKPPRQAIPYPGSG